MPDREKKAVHDGHLGRTRSVIPTHAPRITDILRDGGGGASQDDGQRRKCLHLDCSPVLKKRRRALDLWAPAIKQPRHRKDIASLDPLNLAPAKGLYYPSFLRFSFKPRLALLLCPGKEKDRIFRASLDFLSFSTRTLKKQKMAFASFLGRVLFASVFILSAYQEFNEYGIDGGPAAKALRPKFDAFTHRVHSQVGFQLPEIDIKYLVAGAIALKSLGGILFIFGSTFGAFLLLLHQMIATPILYDFYNYDNEGKEFTQLFIKFTQNMALFGALLFFIGMKNSIPRRQPKKKVPKTKTY